MSPRLKHPNKHFSEIFANSLDFELVSYARAGFSNGGIIVQLETALQKRPDLIIFNTTNSDRTEFRVDQDRATNWYEHSVMNEPYLIYQVGDVSCNSKQTSDEFYTNFLDKRLASLNYNTIIEESNNSLQENQFQNHLFQIYIDWKNKQKTLREYYKHIVDERWERQKQQMMFFTMIYRLEQSNIPYILIHDTIGILNSAYAPHWFTQKHSINDKVSPIRLNPKPLENDPGFHLSYEDSEVVANILIEHYNLYFK